MVNPSHTYSETENYFKSGLYLVATPIGNLQDITLRALDLLKTADLIACEDTRVSGKLLKHFGIKAPLMTYNDHADDKARSKILRSLDDGKIVALISDAGMPLISDPGYKLVTAVNEAGHYLTSLPGANAPLMALQLSALPSNQFCFLGFVPNKQSAREKFWAEWKSTTATLIAFETAPRLLPSLETITAALGDRKIAIARELTKRFETLYRGRAEALITELKDLDQLKGEIVLVIEGTTNDKTFTQDDIDELLKDHLKAHRVKEAAEIVSEITGQKKKDLYNRALELKQFDI